MINNISDCRKRTELIINKVITEIRLNEKRQILILSDRRQQLEDMYKKINEIGDISCGYYIGGLKKDVLKENEKCRILLGTYPMASTGLDIPSLNGLVLATPRSDIIQSIGRIDRIIHTDIEPLIIDICDQFSLFENQCRKRFTIYKKKRYMIQDITYNLDKNTILMNKNYFFHNCVKVDDTDSDKDDEIKLSNIDTEYNDIDPNTNKRIVNQKQQKQQKQQDEEVENLFKKMLLF